jgi:hypothetical protein
VIELDDYLRETHQRLERIDGIAPDTSVTVSRRFPTLEELRDATGEEIGDVHGVPPFNVVIEVLGLASVGVGSILESAYVAVSASSRSGETSSVVASDFLVRFWSTVDTWGCLVTVTPTSSTRRNRSICAQIGRELPIAPIAWTAFV